MLEDHGLVSKEIRLTRMAWRLHFDNPRQKLIDTKTDVQTLASKDDGTMTNTVSVSIVMRFLVKVVVEGLKKRTGYGIDAAEEVVECAIPGELLRWKKAPLADIINISLSKIDQNGS